MSIVQGDFICDECGAYAEGVGFEEFRDRWNQLKDDGWRCTKEGSRWRHFCPSCVQDYARRLG
jgi:hypothetical protein